MTPEIKLYTEKGTVSNTVRNAVKAKAMDKLVDVLSAGFAGDTLIGTDKAVYVHIYNDEAGNPVYLRLDTSISIKDPSAPVAEKASKSRATAEKDPVVIPDLV